MDNHMKTIKIIGLYGVKDDHLIYPSDPNCNLVIIFRGIHGKMLYFIDGNHFSTVGSDDRIPSIQHWTEDKIKFFGEYREQIQKYLDSDEIIISKDDYVGAFDKMAIPLIRRAYPAITHKILSVQPMSTPKGLSEALLKYRTPQDTPEASECQGKAKESQEDA